MAVAQETVLFRLTGKRSEPHAAQPDGARLRPALFARARDLTRLRYDHPAVLVDPSADGSFVRPLSSLVDEALREAAPKGIAGERMRRSALRLEREIRAACAAGQGGRLSAMWERATERLSIAGGADLVSDLARVRAAVRADGVVIDCDGRSAARIVEHAWRAVAERKAAALRRSIDTLVVRLSDLVAADLLRSDAGRDAAHLRAAIGAPHRELFDFDLMARLVAGPSRGLALPAPRRARISRIVDALRAHRALAEDVGAYAFESADAAVTAFRKRLPAMAELVAAIAMGDLEVEGRYVEAEHDGFFRGFDETALTPEDVALFPDPLVLLSAGAVDAPRHAAVVAALTMGAPLKVLVETDDLLGMGTHLATSAMSLGDVFVLQAAGSDLVRVAPRVLAALSYAGPALVSTFTGAIEGSGVPPYLVAAAAKESRTFPTFSYDPSLEGGWHARLSLEGEPRPDRVWPVHRLRYADEALQRVTEEVPFTLADLAVCDPRRSRDLARIVPGALPSGDLVPLGDWLDGDAAPSPTAVPYVNAVDDADRLVRLIVDDRLVRDTRRTGEAWKRLVELSRAGAPAAADVASGASHLAPAGAPAGAPDGAAPSQTAPADGAPGRENAQPPSTSAAAGATEPASSDEAYIETVRCATCNECTNINPRMFAYDENKQAFIKDIRAGTFKDLVEAAESCQVAVIHPGKPRDPSEPGLDELLERAAAFA